MHGRDDTPLGQRPEMMGYCPGSTLQATGPLPVLAVNPQGVPQLETVEHEGRKMQLLPDAAKRYRDALARHGRADDALDYAINPYRTSV